ncbi:unnamed protein product [Microthlaspi erraticum]|uniref:Uncharacterized protein n=1 Tax=Microthlaspi erraticum TaxID=1685480 RepID=A0A6D2KX48_9BRAS|nr:unnamed protein product [Microthlaspi erraticum]
MLANSDKVSEVLQESTHQFNLLTSPTFLPKVKDQGKFTLPCTLGHLEQFLEVQTFVPQLTVPTLSSKSHGATKVVKERVDKEPRVGKDKDERGPRIEKPRLERARVEKPRLIGQELKTCSSPLCA